MVPRSHHQVHLVFICASTLSMLRLLPTILNGLCANIARLGGASAAGQPEVTEIMASPNNISPEGQRKKRYVVHTYIHR